MSIRRSYLVFILVCLATLVLTATALSTAALAGPQLGERFDLAVGESITIDDDALFLRFDKTVSESRCPIDVVCIWPGDAVVQLTAKRSMIGEEEFELHSNSTAGPDAHRYGPYEIRLDEVAPYPELDRPIDPGDYVLSLRVFKVATPNDGVSWSMLKVQFR